MNNNTYYVGINMNFNLKFLNFKDYKLGDYKFNLDFLKEIKPNKNLLLYGGIGLGVIGAAGALVIMGLTYKHRQRIKDGLANLAGKIKRGFSNLISGIKYSAISLYYKLPLIHRNKPKFVRVEEERLCFRDSLDSIDLDSPREYKFTSMVKKPEAGIDNGAAKKRGSYIPSFF